MTWSREHQYEEAARTSIAILDLCVRYTFFNPSVIHRAAVLP